MYNPGEDDNEMDRLSREAASGYKAPGTPNWDAMQERLNKEMPVGEKKRRFVYLWWTVPALILGGIAYTQLKDAPVTARAQEPSAVVTPNNSTADKAPAPQTGNTRSDLPAEKLKQNITEAPKTETETVLFAGQQPGSNKKQFVTKQGASLGNNTSQAGGNDIKEANFTAPVTSPVSITATPEKNAGTTADPVADTKTDTPPANEISATSVQKDSAAETKLVTTNKKKTTKEWSIGVIGSADESTVKLKYGYKPGYGLGVLAGYHFNKTFSLYTGAIYTQKNYKMDGGDFTAPKGSSASYYKLETVEGYCRMWEVPLLARFYTSRTANKGFFLSTGLTSYFMNHESYSYTYHYMGLPGTKNLDYTSSTNHVLSVAHFSAGFESRVGNNLYLQIEPYAKIPLANVGTGKIELSSFGMNIGIQLRKPVKH